MGDNFAARLAQANLATKANIADFVKEIKKITSNETKHVEAEKRLTDLPKEVAQISEKGYCVLLDKIYFTDDYSYQNFLAIPQCLIHYFKGRNFHWKKLLRFRGFLPYSRKFLPRNFSKCVIRESLFPQKFYEFAICKSQSPRIFFQYQRLDFLC